MVSIGSTSFLEQYEKRQSKKPKHTLHAFLVLLALFFLLGFIFAQLLDAGFLGPSKPPSSSAFYTDLPQTYETRYVPSTLATDSIEDHLFTTINTLRADSSLSELPRDPHLDGLAQIHTQTLAKYNLGGSHLDQEGRDLLERAEFLGIALEKKHTDTVTGKPLNCNSLQELIAGFPIQYLNLNPQTSDHSQAIVEQLMNNWKESSENDFLLFLHSHACSIGLAVHYDTTTHQLYGVVNMRIEHEE